MTFSSSSSSDDAARAGRYPPGTLLPGTVYRLVRPLEAEVDEDTGQVWVAVHSHLEQEVVLKLLPSGHPAAERLVPRMTRLEARAQTGLTHPGLVRVLDIGVTSALEPFFVLEKLTGRTLRAELAAAGHVPVPRALDVARQIAEAIAAAHGAGVLHPELRPEKVFLCRGGSVKVMGFGKILDVGAALSDDDQGSVIAMPARAGSRSGASPYAAPEIVARRLATAAADVFSLGVILYEMVAGELPFSETSRGAPLSPPSAVARQVIPADVDRFILRMLADRPAERPGPATELSTELGQIVARLVAQGAADTDSGKKAAVEVTSWEGGTRRDESREGASEERGATASVRGPVAMAAENVYTIGPGSLLAGKYRVVRIIGKGGMGLVVEAHHLHLELRVAMKFLLPEFMSYAEASGRFLREARAASRLTSEHVARVLDVGTLEGGEPYMVMEYLAGEDLSHHARSASRLPVGDVIDYMTQACDAIAEAHKLQIVHRDVKPANLFLTRRADGSALVKVLDFGISKVVGEQGGDIALTQTTTILGSALYMSPEQMVSAKSVDHRTDIYALGVCLFELLGGQLPYFAESFPELCAKIFTSAPKSLVDLRPDLPDELEQAVAKALARTVEERYQSVAELVQALSPFARIDTRARIEAMLRQHAPGLRLLPPAAMTVTRALRKPPRSRAPTAEAPKFMPAKWLWSLAGVGALGVGSFVGWRMVPSAADSSAFVERPESPTLSGSATASVPAGPSASASDVTNANPAPPVAATAGAASATPGASGTSTTGAPQASADAKRSSEPGARAEPPAARAGKAPKPVEGAGPVGPALIPRATSTPQPPVNTDLAQEKCFATMPDGSRKQVPCP
jgi:serine/threonine-protein kinase